MATTTFTTMIPTPSKNPVAKRPGPPVPPRPQQSSLFRTQRDAAGGGATTSLPQRSASKVGLEQPQILKKPAPVSATATGGGRTVIYKSPSLNLPKRQEEREKRGGELQGGGSGTPTTKTNAVTQTTTTRLANGTQAPKPPLKLRKAPDVPTSKARVQTPTEATAPAPAAPAAAATTAPNANATNTENNIVIVQSSQGAVTLNRHHSMNTPSHNKPPTNLKDSRLSLGRADFERVGNKINLNQLQPTAQPLPRPRKIVKIPVATLDVDDAKSNSSSTTSSSTSHNTTTLGVNLFKRSKTTLDNFTSRSHITTVTTGHTGGYLSGKTVEIKNNLKNAAERLFSEIMVNQQKHGHSSSESPGLTNTVITKHERAIQHQTVVETGTNDQRDRTHATPPPKHNVTVVNTSNEEGSLQINDNCTRINITATTIVDAKPPTPPQNKDRIQLQQQQQHQPQHQLGPRQVVSAFNSPEKKSAAFHEMLISELAAMRTRSCSMENLQTKPQPQLQSPSQPQQQHQLHQLQFGGATKAAENLSTTKTKMQDEQSNPDDDIDADNIEDTDGDGDEEHILKKSLKVINASSQNSPRKRTPSGCSSDSSPYGTERSSRIRTSDWIEVGDNGKQVTLTSCHISLEDSGLEDEERMDEMSSSGVGDSWDSVKEAEQHHQQQQQQHQQAKRSRSVKRIMSINDLPPLPKSLSGINKMLASDSGLISDVDTEMARNAKNNEFKQMESQKENNNTNANNNNNNSNINSNNNNNNINFKDTGDKLSNNSTALTAANAVATASASASVTESTTTTTPLKEINGNETISEIPPAIPGSKLDNQIATLRKEMFGLRQLDLTLLSQLWALNDSIQEFRTMIQENEQEDDETYSTHSRSPSPYDSVSSDGDDEISALKGKKLLELQNANASVITTQPKLTTSKSYSPETETNKLTYNRSSSSGDSAANFSDQKSHLIKPPLPKPLDVKPVPRMRSAPPPPPTHRKSQNAPPRPT